MSQQPATLLANLFRRYLTAQGLSTLPQPTQELLQHAFLIGAGAGLAVIEEATKAPQPDAFMDPVMSELETTSEDLAARLPEILRAFWTDRLPQGHTILEQAEDMSVAGLVHQTVRIDATQQEYTRVVDGEEAYGPVPR